MPKIEWGNVEEKKYKYGVDRGVLSAFNSVVPWNGLISVKETEVSGELLTAKLDGMTYLNVQLGGFYQSEITAFSFPDSMIQLLGFKSPLALPGLMLTNQRRLMFDFSYRTMVSNDTYEIHLVHNAVLTPQDPKSSTLANTTEPSVYSWSVSAIPSPSLGPTFPTSLGVKPTAHIVVNTQGTAPLIVTELENVLYGTSEVDPYFPTQQEVANMYIP